MTAHDCQMVRCDRCERFAVNATGHDCWLAGVHWIVFMKVWGVAPFSGVKPQR